MKDSFLLYTSQYEGFRMLSREKKGMLLDAIYNYALSGTAPEISEQDVSIAFSFIRAQMDKDNARYADICRKRSSAGRKGMAARWNSVEDITDDNKDNTCYQELSSDNSENPNSNLIDYSQEETADNKCYQVITSDNKHNRYDISIKKEINKFISQKNKKNKKNIPLQEDNAHTREQDMKHQRDAQREEYVKAFVDFYNRQIINRDANIRPVKRITDKRKDAILTVATRYSNEECSRAIRNFMTSNFANGRTKERSRPADFDWFIREENFVRAIEGSI